jgi:hypothetical protein
MSEGWFAIIDFETEEAFIKHIVYNGTSRQAVYRLYPLGDFSGPWDNEQEAENALDRLIENCVLNLKRI